MAKTKKIQPKPLSRKSQNKRHELQKKNHEILISLEKLQNN